MGDWTTVGPAGNRAYLAKPASGSGPGVLVLHAWWGLTGDVIDVCDRLAQNGFVALAPDLYSDQATADTIEGAEALVGKPNDAESIVPAAADQLRGMPQVSGTQIGVIGFSFGAYWALDLSQTRPDAVSACVTVYGTDGGDYTTAQAAYLGHFAERDDFEPAEAVQSLEERIRAAGRDVTVHTYPGTGHWFFEPSRKDAYDHDAAEQVWERTLAFLRTHLG